MLIRIFTIMENFKTQKIVKDEKGQEVVMIRTDIILKKIMEACQTRQLKWSRWDPKYWHPKHTNLFNHITNYKLVQLDDVKSEIIVGDHIRERLHEKYTSHKQIKYLKSESIGNSGLYKYKIKYVTTNAYERLKRSQPKIGDLLIAFGGSIGKICLISKELGRAITCDLCIFRVKNINPYYVYIYLKSNFGVLQMEYIKNGVGIEHLNSDEFLTIKIPIIPNSVQVHVESRYKEMSQYHDKAMEAKERRDEEEYKKNIQIAEKMLKNLIAKTEAVIRGEREDVI